MNFDNNNLLDRAIDRQATEDDRILGDDSGDVLEALGLGGRP